MRNLLLTSLLALLTSQVFAAKTIRPCAPDQLKYLEASVAGKEPSQQVYFMLNHSQKLVGIFITNNDQNIHAEICDSDQQENYTSASEWFYWDSNIKADPKKWKQNARLGMSQDEGKASIRVLSPDMNGQVTVEFSVIGWDDSKETVLLKDTLKFILRK